MSLESYTMTPYDNKISNQYSVNYSGNSHDSEAQRSYHISEGPVHDYLQQVDELLNDVPSHSALGQASDLVSLVFANQAATHYPS